MTDKTSSDKTSSEETSSSGQQGDTTSVDQLDERWISMIDTALKAQAPLAASYVRKLRTRKPEASPDELLEDVSQRFTNLLTATGAGIGGAAAVPGIGTAAAVGLTVGEGVSFAEACAFLTLSAAALYDVDMQDKATRRMVTMSVLSGERGTEIITKALGKQGVQWNTVLAGKAGGFVPRLINKQVSRWIKRRLMARAGGVWLGRLLPFGVGAVIGGFGSRAMARSVTEAVHDIFQHAPTIEGSIVENRGEIRDS